MLLPARKSCCLIALAFVCFITVQSGHAATRIAPPLEDILQNFTPDSEAEAQVLRRYTHISLDDQRLSQTRTYVAVYINSLAASRDYSQIKINFNSHFEDISLDFAQVRSTDGQLQSVRADAVQIQSPNTENFYHDIKELIFSLPNVNAGSVLEFQFLRTEIHPIIENEWFGTFGFQWWQNRAAGQGIRIDPVVQAKLEINFPNDINLHTKTRGSSLLTPLKNHENNRQVLTWKVNDIGQIRLQDNMPRDEEPAIAIGMSTLSSWQQVSDWAAALFNPKINATNEVDQWAEEIRARALTPEEKIHLVYEMLQERVRYVFAHVGRGGYEPHSAKDVIANGYGDCKDQTILAVTLLRRLGLQAYPALIASRASRKPDELLPQVSFNHMLVYLPKQQGLNISNAEDGGFWLDTTGEKQLFPGNTLALQGQPALIIQENSNSLTRFPLLGPEHHFVHLEIDFKPASGTQVDADLSMSFGGVFEEYFRTLWQLNPEREKALREIVNHLYGSARILELRGEHADDVSKPFIFSAHLRFNDVWKGDKNPLYYAFNFSSLLGVMANLHQLDVPEHRIHNYAIDPGFSVQSTIRFANPSQTHVAKISSQANPINSDYFSLDQEFNSDQERFELQQSLTLPYQILTPYQYNRYYEDIRKILASPLWAIVYEHDELASRLLALEKELEELSPLEGYITKARHHIRYNNFIQAKEAAQNALVIEENNGEAYYLLGLSQGYLNKFDESDQSFQKAQELGYKP